MKNSKTLQTIANTPSTKRVQTNKKEILQTKKQTKKELLNWIFFELNSSNDFKNNKSMYENKKENLLKENFCIIKNNWEFKQVRNNENFQTLLRTWENQKQLWKITLYSNKSILENTWLLEEYNWIDKSKKQLQKVSKIKVLENLYNSLFNVIYHWEVKQDLFWIFKSYNANKIKYNWLLQFDLKSQVEFENSINYFIMNILEDKNIIKKAIKREFIVWKYIQFLKSNSIQLIEEKAIDWELIQKQNDLEDIINTKYILEKLNSTWKIDKYIELLKEKQITIDTYAINRNRLKAWEIKKDKKELHNEYKNKLNSINQKLKIIAKDLKIEFYQ